jgi:hypothetical protein
VKEKVLPKFAAHLEGSMKDSNMGKRGCAIWAFYKAGGERQPLDWRPGGFQP